MTVFGHFSHSEIFFITIDLYLKPGLYICILTYPIAVLCKHPVFKDFLVPFPPSSIHSASLPSTPAPWFYIFILGSSFFFVVLFCLGVHIGPVLYIKFLHFLPFIGCLSFVLKFTHLWTTF